MGARLRSLDGLRGVAALVVVVHHVLLTDPRFAAPYAGHPGSRFPSFAWWLTSTPLHVVWAGPEAVDVFFVLSGLVLTRAALGPSFRWRGYYRGRLARLYLPAWGALALAAAAFELVPRTLSSRHSWWLNAHAAPLTWAWLRHDALLVQGTGWLLTPLWSLKWEVLFSLGLPLAVYAAARHRRLAVVEAAALLAVIALQTNDDTLLFLPMFGLGALMAVHLDALGSLAARLSRRLWWATAVLAVVLLTTSWTLGAGGSVSRIAAIETLGGVLVVFVFAFCPGVRVHAEKRPAQWVGKRSFSLYLIHEPVVVSVALLTGSAWLTLLVGLPLALVVAQCFFVCVEAPCHRLARALGSETSRETVVASALGGA